MIQTKQTYEAPVVQSLVVRFEGVVCTSPGVGANGLQGGNVVTGGGAFDDWDD